MLKLEPLLTAARRTGYAVGEFTGSVLPTIPGHYERQIEAEAEHHGLAVAPNRAGHPDTGPLTPSTAEKAHPSSLSARVGLSQQPFHTDGAHLRRVPDFVILWALEPNATPTLVWVDPWRGVEQDDRLGIFLVHPGGEPFFAPAVEFNKLRFDPVCMSPADARARHAEAALTQPPDGATVPIEWDAPGRILVLRNRRVLHARAAVTAGDEERQIFRTAFYEVS